MAILLGYASADENGKAKGGKAGDQTGKEVKIAPYYKFGQTYILRWKNDNLGVKASELMAKICKSSLVGYDQNQRTTLYNEMKKAKWDFSKVKTACECDCSSLIAVIVNAMGIEVNPNIWTGNMREALLNTGQFVAKTGTGWTNTDANLLKGDIILNPASHVAMALENGSNIKPVAKPYAKSFPTLPKRGYFEIGDKGEQVIRVQDFCNWAVNTKLATDGSYGAKTSEAVKKFQKVVGLTADGSYGSKTLAKAKAFRR